MECFPGKPKYIPEFDEIRNSAKEMLISYHRKAETDENVKSILSNRIKAEYEFFVSKDFKLLPDKDGARFHGIIDVISKENAGEITFGDWKTGKSKASFEQLKFYSIFGFRAFKGINTIRAKLIYLDQDKVDEMVITRDESREIENSFLEETEMILSDVDHKRNFKQSCIDYCEYFKECNPIMNKTR